jgi:hypothetical protein
MKAIDFSSCLKIKLHIKGHIMKYRLHLLPQILFDKKFYILNI